MRMGFYWNSLESDLVGKAIHGLRRALWRTEHAGALLIRDELFRRFERGELDTSEVGVVYQGPPSIGNERGA